MQAANFFILDAKDVTNRDAMPDWMKVTGNTRIGPETGKVEYNNGTEWALINPNTQVFFLDMFNDLSVEVIESVPNTGYLVKTFFNSEKPSETLAERFFVPQ